MSNSPRKKQGKTVASFRMKLTDSIIRGLVHQGVGDRTLVWDSLRPGLGVAVYPSGRKSFVLFYRTLSGRQRRMTLKEPETIGEARAKAKKVLAKVDDGGDPMAEKEERRAAMTLGEFWEEIYLHHVEKRWKDRTKVLHSRLWEKRIKPTFGDCALSSIRMGDVQAWHTRGRATPGEQNIALRLLKAMLNHAVAIELIAGRSPAARVEPFPSRRHERFLNGEELQVLFRAIDVEEAAGGKASVERAKPSTPEKDTKDKDKSEETEPPKKTRGGLGQKEVDTRGITPHAAGLFRLLIFTGARLREIMHARWSWVDWEARALRLPDSKTGPRRILLSTPALEELRRIEKWRTVGNPWIIEGRTEGAPLVNPQKPWGRVRARAGAILNERRVKANLDPLEKNPFDGVRLHDLRHSFASIAVAEGLGLPIVGKALGHAQLSTTERYSHLANDPVAAGVELVGAAILRAMKEPVAVVEPIEKAEGEK